MNRASQRATSISSSPNNEQRCCNNLNLRYNFFSNYHPNSGVTLLSSFSLFILSRFGLISEELIIYFYQNIVSHEMLHHVELEYPLNCCTCLN
jgi:hypothetical protein